MQQSSKDIHPLKRARLKLGYTQVMLADFAQVGEATIQRAENGKPLRPDTVQQLCTYFSECYKRPVDPGELGLVQEDIKAQPYANPEQVSSLLISHLLENQEFLTKLRQSIMQGVAHPVSNTLNQFGSSDTLNENLIAFFESMMLTQWNTYYTGGAERVMHGLTLFLKQIEQLAQTSPGSVWHLRILRLLAVGYQLQNCVLRDRHSYTQASIAYQKAFNIAQELEDNELIASALARQGVSLVQQAQPKQAILYLDNALTIIGTQQLPKLRGYILQALSEAHAQNNLSHESWSYLAQAEAITVQPAQEQSFIRFNPSSTLAQKGVDAVFLGEYKNALEFLDQGLQTYDPTGISGRARLIAMKAEAYCKLGILDGSVSSAQEAFILARSIGSSKIIARLQKLYIELQQSLWKDEKSVARLGGLLYSANTESE